MIPKDCELAKQNSVNIGQLKSLPLILSEQTFSGHQELEWFGLDYSSLNVIATYNLIYNATFMVEHGIGYALCLDRLVNTEVRNLAFRPITPELSVDLYISNEKITRLFRLQVKAFLDLIRKNLLTFNHMPIMEEKSLIISEILICCGHTCSQLWQPTQFAGRSFSGMLPTAIGARNPPPVILCSL